MILANRTTHIQLKSLHTDKMTSTYIGVGTGITM